MRALFPLVALLAGCGGGGPDGIWLLQINPSADEPEPATVTHNFAGARVTSEVNEEGWTSEEDQQVSSRLQFAQIVTGAGDTAALVIDDAVFPGTITGSIATFEWIGHNATDGTLAHETGYQFVAETTEDEVQTYSFTFDGASLTGTRVSTSSVDKSWTESDTWQPEARPGNGQIPSSQYLVVQAPSGAWVQAVNTRENADCTSSPCSLSIQSDFEENTPISGTWFDYADDSAYESLEDAGQAQGI